MKRRLLRKRQGEASSHLRLGGGRGSQAHNPLSSPDSVPAASARCRAGWCRVQVLLRGPDSHCHPHGGLLWLTALVCLSLPAGIFVLPWPRVALVALLGSSAEKLLLYLHLGWTGQECQSFINFLPWHGWRWDVPAPTVTAGASVTCNTTLHLQEQTRLVQRRVLPDRYHVSKSPPHCQSVHFILGNKREVKNQLWVYKTKDVLPERRGMRRGTSPRNKHHILDGVPVTSFFSVVLFHLELSGLWGSFVGPCFFMNDLRVWVTSNFFPIFKEAWL